jgi:hypothetical protein
MTPSARALYWYLVATQQTTVEIPRAATESGIPTKTIYEQIRNYPDVFELRGSAVARRTRQP